MAVVPTTYLFHWNYVDLTNWINGLLNPSFRQTRNWLEKLTSRDIGSDIWEDEYDKGKHHHASSTINLGVRLCYVPESTRYPSFVESFDGDKHSAEK